RGRHGRTSMTWPNGTSRVRLTSTEKGPIHFTRTPRSRAMKFCAAYWASSICLAIRADRASSSDRRTAFASRPVGCMLIMSVLLLVDRGQHGLDRVDVVVVRLLDDD